MFRVPHLLPVLLAAIGLSAACGQPQQAPPAVTAQPVGPRADAPNPANFVAEQYLVLEPNPDSSTSAAKPCILSLQNPNTTIEKELHTGQGRNVMWVLENDCDKNATLTFDFGTNHPLVKIPGKADKGVTIAPGDLHFLAARIRNVINGPFPVKFPYTVTLKYGSLSYSIDPDVIIEF